MGSKPSLLTRIGRSVCLALAAACLMTGSRSATAQTVSAEIANSYLDLILDTTGGIYLATTGNNPTDPNTYRSPPFAPTNMLGGSVIIFRVDGGPSSQIQNGFDAIFGTTTIIGNFLNSAGWIQPPVQVGNHIEAKWGAGARVDNNLITRPYALEIDLFASFVHNTVRLQFTVKNLDKGLAHNVSMAMVQNVVTGNWTAPTQGASLLARMHMPIRVPNYPYLRTETVLEGGLLPPYWETFYPVAASTDTAPAKIHSLRGTLKPSSSLQQEPTPPARFIYAQTQNLLRLGLLTGGYSIFNFTPDPTVRLDQPVPALAQLPSVGLIWSGQTIGAGATRDITTFLGQADSDNDFSPPVTLTVTAPQTLGFKIDRATKKCVTTPNPFTITAAAQNLTDLLTGGGVTIGPVSFFLDLPKGLKLDPNGRNPNPIVVNSIAPGNEGTVSWSVVPDDSGDPRNRVNGNVRFSVSMTPNLGNGKVTSRSVELPAPPVVNLKSNDVAKGLFQMLSLPFIFNNAQPSTILGLNADPPDFDLVRFNAASGHYEPVNTFQPGYSYWIRSRLPESRTQPILIDCSLYPPVDNQILPTAVGYKVNYPLGWNQVGNPFLYGIRFSEIRIFDSETLTIVGIDQAGDPYHNWILPAIYRYDNSDPDPRNWGYQLIDNLGFIMQPYEGYWMLARKSTLQFIFPGVDTPGSSISRSAQLGVGLGANSGRNTPDNWRLQLSARGEESSDLTNYIGVAPHATDGADRYKYPKPPLLGSRVALDILHPDWKDGDRYGQDLRSPAPARKTWDLLVRSGKPNEQVTVSWPDVTATVPRSFRLTLVDGENGTRMNMRTVSSHTLRTNANATRKLQIVAEPASGAGVVRITRLDVVQAGGGPGRAATSAAIHYGLSETAEAVIVIRDAGGRTLRTLTPGTRAADGSDPNGGSAVWDLKDQKGVSLAPGLYHIEVTARGQEGQQSRRLVPYVITR